MLTIHNNCTDAQWNMAHDEFLLEGLRETVLCLWQNAPAVIIGRNQSAYAEVNQDYLKANSITLARRVTGGGAVYHDLGNLNYSIAGPAREVEKHYGTMAHALQNLGLRAELSGRNDIMVDGRKCSGWAKRLYKDRMLIHGTLMWNVNLQALTEALSVPGSKLQAAGIASVRSRVVNLKPYLPQFNDIADFRHALEEMLSTGSMQLSGSQLEQITKLADSKFRTWDWIYGHSPAATFEKTAKFPCGTVTARYTLSRGVFSVLEFRGDFIGEKPAEELALMLIGKKPEDLMHLKVRDYFDSLTAKELALLF